MPLLTSDQATEIALKQDGIIPDVLDSFHGSTMLVVSYGANKDVSLGNTLAVNGKNFSFLPGPWDSRTAVMLSDPSCSIHLL